MLIFFWEKTTNSNEIADLLDEEFYNDEDNTDRAPIKIVMFPPKDKPGAESEGDSDDEDAPTCNITRLSSRLLQTEGEVSRGKEIISRDVSGTLVLLRNTDQEMEVGQVGQKQEWIAGAATKIQERNNIWETVRRMKCHLRRGLKMLRMTTMAMLTMKIWEVHVIAACRLQLSRELAGGI